MLIVSPNHPSEHLIIFHPSRPLKLCLISGLAISLFAACSAPGPKYERPELELPAPPARAVKVERNWWSAFADPALDALIREALKNNWDLAKAAASVEEARAATSSARALKGPRLDGQASINASQRQLTVGLAERDIERTVTTSSLGAVANWEVDLWGRVKSLNDAAIARLNASEHARDAVELSIASTVTETWFQLRATEEQIRLSREAVDTLKAVSDLEYRRWKAKAGTELAYRQSVAEVASVESRIPYLEGAALRTELALRMLIGRSPRAMTSPLDRSGSINLPSIPAEVDAELLLRRPDVALAELQLVAAHIDVSTVRAERYPRLNLSLLAGLMTSTGSAISGMPFYWGAGADLMGPIYDGGLNDAKVDSAEARRQRAIAQYRQTVSLAFKDTYEALLLTETSDRQYTSIEQEIAARKVSLALTEKSYAAGRSSKYEVLSETIKVLNADMSLANAKLDQFIARTRYFKAVGGGF